jgi:pimeloyl-ACP methyl ester carboxylesterase
LLHGVTDSGPCWGRTADALARSHDVILLDQRGHGLSDAPAEGYRLIDLAGDAAGIIRGLDVAPAAVVGHSLGAMVALTLAAGYPHLVSRLVLEDPPLDTDRASRGAEGPHPDEQRYAWFGWLRDLHQLSEEELAARCRAQSPSWSAEECEAWAKSKLRTRSRLWEPGGLDFRTDWRTALAQVRCPAMLVYGDAELGSLIDDALAAEAQGLMRSGRAVRIHQAGHSIHRDRFNEFFAEVALFLDEGT